MKLGLCLSGGGSRGAYQVGACMALKEAGIYQQVQAISGSSIGSINAVMLASKSIEEVRDIWFSIPKDTLKSTESVFKKIIKERTKLINHGIYEIKNLERKILEYLDLKKLRTKEVYITISKGGEDKDGLKPLIKDVYHHYIKHEKHVLYLPCHLEEKQDIIKQVIASCSIPFVFSPEIINGNRYYDGGVYDNVPVKPLIDAGCDKIIVIHLEKLPYFYKHRYPDIKFYSLKPKKFLGWVLNFNPDNSRIRYEQGYKEMQEYLQKNRIL